MDQQRGRSPSQGHQQPHIKQNHSPSPQHFQENDNNFGSGLGLNAQQQNNNIQQQQQYMTGGFNPSNSGIPSYSDNNNLFMNQQGPSFSTGGLADSTFAQSQEFPPQFKQEAQSPFGQNQPGGYQDLLNTSSQNFNEDFNLFPTPSGQDSQFEQSFFVTEGNNASVNPSQLDMASPQSHAATPPFLQPDSQNPSSTHQSPSFSQGQFQRSPSHSRHTSLGPESAAFPQGQVDWSNMNMMQPQFQGHRRTPSEYSDVSASSAHHSPNLPQHESFDSIDQHHSPMQTPQDASLYNEVLNIGNFSLSDPQVQHGSSPGRGLSPAHSPAISPRLGPQQMPNVNQQNNFMLNGYQSQQSIYPMPPNDPFPQIRHGHGSLDMGQAQQMVPPEINVEFAPASRQNSFEPPKPSLDQDALTPPDRGRRRRAVSDITHNSASAGSHQRSQSNVSIGLGSDLVNRSPDSRSLSPNDRSGASSPSGRRRQSTSSLPNREYILGLADPEYQAASSESGNSKRVQKHPATFQCTLCPKRFTRAYNLRSHLRTHTDERPFVCTVCGKAFARQHDRKRHEGLHSGEKKFVCKGELKTGGHWGCGRKFARADALGRHFRSEAGRICIKPLLDEEAIERQRVWQEQRMQNMQMQQPQPNQLDANGFPMDASGNYTLPAALLAQYPALANLSWADLPQGDAGMEDDLSGRSSFDASGSEYYEEDDGGGYVSSGPGPVQYGQPQQMADTYQGYSSDIGGR